MRNCFVSIFKPYYAFNVIFSGSILRSVDAVVSHFKHDFSVVYLVGRDLKASHEA